MIDVPTPIQSYRMGNQGSSQGTLDVESGTSSRETQNNRTRWPRRIWFVVPVVGVVFLLTGYFIGRNLSGMDSPVADPSAAARQEGGQFTVYVGRNDTRDTEQQQNSSNKDGASNKRILRVKGSDPCTSPFCKTCKTTVPAAPPLKISDHCHVDSRWTILRDPSVCLWCDPTSCLTYSDLKTRFSKVKEVQCEDTSYHRDHMCCLLKAVGNRADYCNGGTLKCEADNKPPTCECPLGKEGPRCERIVPRNNLIACNCHKDVLLCEDDIAMCDQVHFNQAGNQHCQKRIDASDGAFYSCYCNNTENVSNSSDMCDDLVQGTDNTVS